MASLFIPRSVQNNKKGKGRKKTIPLKTKETRSDSNIIQAESRFTKCPDSSQKISKSAAETLSELSFFSETKKFHETIESDEDDEVVSFSKNQRWPAPGEPVCVFCGRYGEYICDQTDKDVCSLECKAKNLRFEANKYHENESSRIIPSKNDNKYIEEVSHGHFQHIPISKDNLYCVLPYKYKAHSVVEALTKDQVDQLRTNTEIQVKGENIPNPILEFEHCQLPDTLNSNLSGSGYKTPTPVQMQLLPLGLEGRDVMASAQTGSGKTAAFLLPMIARIHHEIGQHESNSPSLFSPLGLILAPTRELCMQIEEQAKQFMKGLERMKTALIVGGLPLPPQVHRLKAGVQFVIATPGRLLEVLNKFDVELSCVRTLVLDEVDTMLQLGFEGQVKHIIQQLPTQRQTLLFSATIPASIEKMAEQILSSPVFVSVGLPSAPNTSVKQIILWVEDKSKKKRLFSILQDHKHFRPPVVVFVDSKMGADLLAEAIEKTCDISCASMHGDKSQEERNRILQSFLAGAYPVIVCTGVLGRGVDLVNVKQVINFDMPSTIEEYIHQIGRAGRLGTSGWALTFINSSNKNVFLDLVSTLEPLGVNLPPQLTNSPYLHQQKQRKTKEFLGKKRKHRDEFVTQDNLMELLKKSAVRRRR